MKGVARIRLKDDRARLAELHWYEAHGIGKRDFKVKFTAFGLSMSKRHHKYHFAVCLNNDDYKASLEVGKLYQVIPDKDAEAHGLIRVIDESGEDYGFAASRFHRLDIPPAVQKAVLSART